MSPTPTATQASPLVGDFFDRGLRAQSAVTTALAAANGGAAGDDARAGAIDVTRFDECLTVAALAIANADRALRAQPPVTHASALHPAVLSTCREAATRAVLEQHPAARLDAFNDTGDELQRFVEKILEDPDKCAICHDPVLMKDACVAMIRVLSSTYRKSLAGQMSVLRSAEGVTP